MAVNNNKMCGKFSDVPLGLKSVAPVVGGKATKLTLAQANKLAGMYLETGSVAEAKVQFRRLYVIKGGKWMSKAEKKDVPKGSVLNELWASVQGSYENDQQAIQTALRGSEDFGIVKEEYSLNLEATFKDSVIVSNNAEDAIFYRATWAKGKDGSISFSDIEKVEAEMAFKSISEQKELVAEMRQSVGKTELNEDILTPVQLNEKVDSEGKKTIVGSVNIAQRADVLNSNNRRYRETALKEAVDRLQVQMKDQGPLLMDSIHRVKADAEGKETSHRDLRETVALIHDVGWNEDDKTVSLRDIRFLETQAGKDLVALIDGGAHLQVSQRAIGTSELIREDGKVVEDVTSLEIGGWDFTPPGKASIAEADFEFKVMTEGIEMPDKVLSADEVASLLTESENKMKEAVVDTLKEAGLLTEEKEANTKTEDDSQGEEAEKELKEETASTSESEMETEELKQQVQTLEKTLADDRERVETLVRKDEMDILRTMATELLQEEVSGENYKHFNEGEKKVLLESVDVETVHGTVDLADREAVGNSLKPMLEAEAAKLDRYKAEAKLIDSGFPQRGQGGEGITHVEILDEAIPNMEYIAKLSKAVEKRLEMRGIPQVIDKDHHAMTSLNEIMAVYDKQNYRKLLNEADEEVTQLDIGARIASVSRVIIPAAFRRLTALDVCDVGTMAMRIEDVPVSQWLPAESGDISDDMATIEIAEGGTIPTAGVKYVSVPLVATRKAIRTFITSESRATARGTNMNPEADAVAGLALDVQRRLDRLLWQLMISSAQAQASTTVTSWTELTLVAGTTYEFESVHEGWISYELCKTYDANTNPTGSKLEKLFSETPGADITLQAVTVRENGGDNTALVYADDYSINWPDGTITLTAAGLAKCVAGTPDAKYTYTTNAKFWSVTPPSGVTLYDHLINLRQSVGQAKVLIGNRHYEPGFLGASLETEDLITSGPQFTASGATASDMLDRLNNVLAYAGLAPTKTSAIPQSWIVVGEKASCLYKVHTPWSLRGPITNETTGSDYYIAEEYSGCDVPVKEKLAVVGITDLNT